jgi:hypothetical protein
MVKATGSTRFQDFGSEPIFDLEHQGPGRAAAAGDGLNSPMTDGGFRLSQGAPFLDKSALESGRQDLALIPVDPGTVDFNLERALDRMAASGDGRAAAAVAEAGGFVTLASFPAVVQLSGIDGTNGYVFSGPGPGQRSGYRVAAAEDVNGDGVADIVIGGGNGFVVFGGLANFAALDALDGATDGRIEPTSLRSGRASNQPSRRTVARGSLNPQVCSPEFIKDAMI